MCLRCFWTKPILPLILILSLCSCFKNSTGPGTLNNYALSFDGVNDCVFVKATDTELDNLTTEFTVESWIYINSYTNVAPRIIDRSDNTLSSPDGDRIVFNIYEPDGTIALNINGYKTFSNPLPLGTWVHVASTYNGSEIKVYVNGQLIRTSSYSGSIDVRDSELSIGNANAFNRPFDGYIDEVRIWDVCRTESQIQQNMNSKLLGTELGLLCYWNFDEGTGQWVVDKTNNDINGYLGITEGIDSSDPEWFGHDFPFID